jgi:hypothetical protein
MKEKVIDDFPNRVINSTKPVVVCGFFVIYYYYYYYNESVYSEQKKERIVMVDAKKCS